MAAVSAASKLEIRMTPFQLIVVKAREGALEQALETAYFASNTFEERLRFMGDDGLKDKVRVTLEMLKLVALDPRDAHARVDRLRSGLVWLEFFGVCNPVPMFEIAEGSDEALALEAAARENLESRMFDAAKRVRAWRAPKKVSAREKQETSVVEQFRATLSWPVFDRSKADQSQWRAEQEMLLARVGAKRAEVRERRTLRLAALSRATGPQVGSWTGLIEVLARKALGPLQ
jgi:hypothetical protein